MLPNRYEYRPNVSFQYFPPEYFSGCDIHIFLGDLWLSEIHTFEYYVQTNTLPMYGYASYSPDKISLGATLVTGRFIVNKRGAYNIFDILRHNDPVDTKRGHLEKYGKDYEEKVLELEDQLTAGTLRSEDIGQIAAFQKAKWWGVDEDGETESLESIKTQAENKGLWSKNIAKVNKSTGRDLIIVYGKVSDYGDIMQQSQSVVNNLTIVKGLVINGVSEAGDMSGQPIGNVFNFMAKDIIFGFPNSYVGA